MNQLRINATNCNLCKCRIFGSDINENNALLKWGSSPDSLSGGNREVAYLLELIACDGNKFRKKI
jgi:hypothetical protein